MTIDTKALRALHSKAEAGRLGVWSVDRRRLSDPAVGTCDGGLSLASCHFDGHAALIVAAVNALVPLCNEVERLRAECESLRREADLAHAAACSAAGDGVRT